jgi:hypothetical protein
MSRSQRKSLASGSRVAGGRLRVDAARAVRKLRDYQLADPAMWALEALRAARAADASAAYVAGDADDVWVGWEGATIPAEALTRLLDELVSPQASEDQRALRLLAIAINTALGLRPRWVDVWSVQGERALRVRYTPHVLVEGAEGVAEGLRRLVATPAPPPAGAPPVERGTIIHLRRPPTLEALSLLATGKEPREVRLVRRACENFPIPLQIGAGPLALPNAAGDLLRLRIDPARTGPGRSAFLAIVDPSAARGEAWVDFAELGVVLATMEFPIGLQAGPGWKLPVRLYVDAPRLPTNVSRATVRRDERWIAEIEKCAVDLLPDLMRCLASELGPAPASTWTPERRERLRAAAFHLVGAAAGGPLPDVRPDALAPLVRPLLEVEIARDAVGRARTLVSLAARHQGKIHVGREPIEPELAPWVGDVPWCPPGDPGRRLWGDRAGVLSRRDVEQARAHVAARQAWLARPTTPAALGRRPDQIVVAPLRAPDPSAHSCIPAEVWAEGSPEGEVAILAAEGGRTTIRLLVEGRPTEVVTISGALTAEAVATAQDLSLTPNHGAVAADAAKHRLLQATEATMVVAVESIARRLSGDSPPAGEKVAYIRDAIDLEPETAARLVRAGTRLAVQVLQRLGSGENAGARALLESKSPLLSAKAWPSIDGTRASLAELGTEPVIGYVLETPRAAYSPRGRKVLVVDAHERDLLGTLWPGRLVSYEGRLGVPPRADRLAREIAGRCVIALSFEQEGRRGALGWRADGGASAIALSHLGTPLATTLPPPRTAHPVILRVDDDAIVPDPDWKEARVVPDAPPLCDARELEAALACAAADVLLGREPPGVHHSLGSYPHPMLAYALLRTCSKSTGPQAGRKVLGHRVDALRTVPFLPRAFTAERASIAGLIDEFGPEIPYLAPPIELAPGASPTGFHPLLLPHEAADGLVHLFGVRVRWGQPDLEEKIRKARRAQIIERHRLGRAMACELDTPITAPITGEGLRGSIGFPSRAGNAQTAAVHVLFLQRPLIELTETLPWCEAIVEVDAELLDDDLELHAGARSRLRSAVRGATSALALEVARAAAASGRPESRALEMLAAWCGWSPAKKGKRAAAQRTIAELRKLPLFRSVQGPMVSVEQALCGRIVRICEPIADWLGPPDGEEPSALDTPILVLPSDPASPERRLLESICPEELRNVSAEVRRLQARRRIQWGRASRPRLGRCEDARFRWTLEDLTKAAAPDEASDLEAFGPGELAFAPRPPSRVIVYQSGVAMTTLEWDLRPPVWVACEPADVDLSHGGRPPPARERLANALRVAIVLAQRRLRETADLSALPGWLRSALRDSALSGGLTHLQELADVPLFETTAGRFVTPRELAEQAQTLGTIWYTTVEGSSLLPLDERRFALRLTRDEAARLVRMYPALDASEELRLDALARAHLARPRVRNLEPGPAARAQAIGVRELAADGSAPWRGWILALHPAHTASRAFHVFRDGLPLGRLPDPSEWPAVSWVDDPRLQPDRTWSQPVDDAALARVRAKIAEEVEAALRERFPLPTFSLGSIRVDRELSREALRGRPTSVQFRGVLYLEDDDAASIQVEDAYETAHRVVSLAAPGRSSTSQPAPLPISGWLLATGAAGSALEAPLAAVARLAYERLIAALVSRIQEPGPIDHDLARAALVRAAALGIIDAAHPACALAMPFVWGEPGTLGALRRALAEEQRVLLVSRSEVSHVGELGWTGLVLVDDGSLALRRAVLTLGERVVPFARALAAAALGDCSGEPGPGPAMPAPATEAPRPSSRQDPTDAQRSAERVAACASVSASSPSSNAGAARDDGGDPALLVDRLSALIRARGAAHGSARPITVDPLGSQPELARLSRGTITIAARHPLISAVARRGADEQALAILAAHALGVASADDDDAVESELHAILALLRE